MRREIVLQFQASLDGASSGPASSAEDNAAHAARVWPQFRVVPGGIAAPAPSSLQPLRAWLPDAEEPEADAHHGVGSAADPLPLAS